METYIFYESIPIESYKLTRKYRREVIRCPTVKDNGAIK